MQFFPAADKFFDEVRNVTQIRDRLSPNTQMDIDEIGVILPGDNQNTPNPPAIYWNSAGALFAYIFGNLCKQGIHVLGESQLMGYPPLNQSQFPASPGGIDPQFASVTEIDWGTGEGNARYWTLKMLIEQFSEGDAIVQTTVSDDSSLFAQGFVKEGTNEYLVLIVNKINDDVTVEMDNLTGGKYYVCFLLFFSFYFFF